jgi:Holliday junction resolvasome RuvABC endonuclease subunit
MRRLYPLELEVATLESDCYHFSVSEIIMALDMSPSCTGIAIGPVAWDGDVSKVILTEVYSTKTPKGAPESDWLYRMVDMGARVARLAWTHKVKVAYVEGYAFSMKFGACRIGENGFAIKSALLKEGVDIKITNMSSARKTLTGSGRAKKVDCWKALTAHGFNFGEGVGILDRSDAMVVWNHAVGELGGYCLVG